MIASVLYGLCFLIILLNPDNRTKIMAGLCLAYLFINNLIFWYFLNAEFFDITFYLNICWALDSTLLFAVGCTVKGLRQILVIALSVPLMLCQVFVIQYPSLFPEYLYVFAVQGAHGYFIEMFIFVHSWQDNTIREWLKTGSVLCLVFMAHMF